MTAAHDRIPIGPALIDVLSIDETVAHIVDHGRAGSGGYVMTHNLEHLWLREHDPQFDELSANANLAVADGQPLVLVSRIRNTPLPERVGGIDLFERLMAAAGDAGLKPYFVGGNEGAAAGAVALFQKRHPDLTFAGHHMPPFGLKDDPELLEEHIQLVVAAQPDIVCIGLPSQLQAIMADRFRELLPNAWVLGVGVSFSFVTGEVARAPEWVQRVGLEWLHRMLQQPDLTRRYLVRCVPLGLRLVAGAASHRLRNR